MAGCSAPAKEPTPNAPTGSTVTLVDEPWITAPASVSTFTNKVRLEFSAPVDRPSVEEHLKAELKAYPATFSWASDQALLVTVPGGCASFKIGAAGAKDARGAQLEPQHNPDLNMHMPCHGSGYTVVELPDGKPVAGFPQNGILVDTDPTRGRLLGRNGTVYFLVEGGKPRKLWNTVSSEWARFLPDGNVLLADEKVLRTVTPDGKEVTVAAGEAKPAGDATISAAPDGRWLVVFKAGKVALGQQGSAHRVVMADLAETDRPVAFWTPDSRHVLLPGGQVIEVDTGREVVSLAMFKTCGTVAPAGLGKVGATLVAAFVDNCH